MTSLAVAFDIIARDKASKTFAQVGKAASKTGDDVSRVHKVSVAAARGLALGFAAAAVGAVKLSQAAADDEQAQVKLATSLRNATGATDSQVASVESWITAQGKALGVTDDELRPALARLATATGDVGQAQRLAALAMNVSAGTGKSLESVTTALAKAQNGNLSGLQRLGVATKDAQGKTLSLEQVTANLAKTYRNQAAKSAETVAGKQKILSTQAAELGESFGAKLQPALLAATSAGLGVVNWIDRNQTAAKVLAGAVVGLAAAVASVSVATTVATAAQTAYGAAVLATNSYVAVFVGVKALELSAWARATAATAASTAAVVAHAAAAKVATVASKAVAVATKAWAAGQWLLNAALTANPIGLIVAGVAALIAGLVLAYKKSDTFRAIVQATGKAGQVAIGWVVSKVKDLVGKVVSAGASIKSGFETGFKPIQWAIDKIQDLIGWVSKIKIPNLGGALSKIPGFAGGVTNFRGGLAVVGESGPELVRLPRGSDVIPNHHMGSVAASAGAGVHIENLYARDDEAVGRSIRREQAKANLLAGLS